nr:hypothetical protein [Anaerobacillus isosaccharinicus]
MKKKQKNIHKKRGKIKKVVEYEFLNFNFLQKMNKEGGFIVNY